MIRPIAPTHREAAVKAERIRQAKSDLDKIDRNLMRDNVAYGFCALFVMVGAVLLGRLLALIVLSLN